MTDTMTIEEIITLLHAGVFIFYADGVALNVNEMGGSIEEKADRLVVCGVTHAAISRSDIFSSLRQPAEIRAIRDTLAFLTRAEKMGIAQTRLQDMNMLDEVLEIRAAFDDTVNRVARLLDLVPAAERDEPRFSAWLAARMAERDRILADRARCAAEAARVAQLRAAREAAAAQAARDAAPRGRVLPEGG